MIKNETIEICDGDWVTFRLRTEVNKTWTNHAKGGNNYHFNVDKIYVLTPARYNQLLEGKGE